MGSGSWTSSSFTAYSTSRGRSVKADGSLSSTYGAEQLFTAHGLAKELNPYKVMRECRDSEEHPETVPVILALDVTGSMGSAAAKVAQQLNTIMTDLYSKVKDVEFLIMAIGDLAYDDAPIQASQFESDIRIAEQLDKVYFEAGGGGNAYESYTAAWYFGLHHTDLDCWKRGKKGIIITLGDEPLNPYLPKTALEKVCGKRVQGDIETKELYEEVIQKFDVYHIVVDDSATAYRRYGDRIKKSWKEYLDEEHFKVVNLNTLAGTISDIIAKEQSTATSTTNEITW